MPNPDMPGCQQAAARKAKLPRLSIGPSDMPDKFYAPIGRVSVTWNSIQSVVFFMFWGFCDLPKEEAESIFYSMSSDRAQTAATKAIGIVKLGLADSGLQRDFKDIITDIQEKRGKRNAVVHHAYQADQLGFVGVALERSQHNERMRSDPNLAMAEAEKEAGELLTKVIDFYGQLGLALSWQYEQS